MYESFSVVRNQILFESIKIYIQLKLLDLKTNFSCSNNKIKKPMNIKFFFEYDDLIILTTKDYKNMKLFDFFIADFKGIIV